MARRGRGGPGVWLLDRAGGCPESVVQLTPDRGPAGLCPIPDCGGMPDAGVPLCRRCWFQVPEDLRKAYWLAVDRLNLGKGSAREVTAATAAAVASLTT